MRKSRSSGGLLLKALGYGLLAAALAVVGWHQPVRDFFSFEHIRHTTAALGALGPLAIIAFGIVTPLLFLPRWPLAMVSGLLYGVGWGVLLATFASALGAWLQYALARTVLARPATRLVARSRLAKLTLPQDKTFLAVFLLRAFPFSNFVLTNLLAGLLALPVGNYLAASFLGMLPSSFIYAACGKFMKQPSPRLLFSAFFVLALISVGTVVTHRRWTRWFRPAAADAPTPASDPLHDRRT